MKIAIPSNTASTSGRIDERFGRCTFFCIYDSKKDTVSFIKNTEKDAAGGVGPQVAEYLAKSGINEVYAFEFGPKAQKALNDFNIKTHLIEQQQTVSELIDLINNKNK